MQCVPYSEHCGPTNLSLSLLYSLTIGLVNKQDNVLNHLIFIQNKLLGDVTLAQSRVPWKSKKEEFRLLLCILQCSLVNDFKWEIKTLQARRRAMSLLTDQGLY